MAAAAAALAMRKYLEQLQSSYALTPPPGVELRAGEKAFAKLPVVILSTLGEKADKERALKLGASGYLVKLDFQEKDLIRVVRRFLD